jgi:hypothetical protein
MPKLGFPRKKKKVVIEYKDEELGVAKNPGISSAPQNTQPPPEPQSAQPSPEQNKKAGSVGQTAGNVISTVFAFVLFGFLGLIVIIFFFGTLLHSCMTY